MGLYKKKLVTRDGDKKIRRDSHFDTGKYRVGDRVKHKNGDIGTILFMIPIGKHFLIEFSDLNYGATDQDLIGHAHEG